MLNKNDIDKIQAGDWEFLSTSLTLTKKKNDLKYSGPGIIRQIENKAFEYIIFDLKLHGDIKDNLSHYMLHDKIREGELIPHAETYTLSSIEGWSAENLYNINLHYTETGSIIKGYTVEISKIIDHTDTLKILKNISKIKQNNSTSSDSKTFYKKSQIIYIFFEKLNYPASVGIYESSKVDGENSLPGWRLDALKFDTDKYNFRFYRAKDYTEIKVKSLEEAENFDNLMKNRAIEALEFSLGRPIHWNIMVINEGNIEKIHIRLTGKNKGYNRLARPPIRENPSAETSPHFQNLLKNYLEFTLLDNDNNIHPLSKYLREIFYSYMAGFETHALTLSTQIEGLLRFFYSGLVTVDNNFITEINEIKTFIENSNLDLTIRESTLDKFYKHLGYLVKTKNLPINKTFKALLENSVINKRDVIAWNKIRHIKSHGEKLELSQEKYDCLNKITVILHQLVFNLIGYTGIYTDYGELGFPFKKYIAKNLY